MNNVQLNKIVYSLNAILPADIAIKKAVKVKSSFHARYSAKKRIYKYLLTKEKRAIDADKYFFIKTKFDIDSANKFCKLLIGEHSFKSFCKNKTDKHNFICNVFSADIQETKKGLYAFTISANRYLHSMVRAIAGMLLKIASSKITITEFKNKFIKGEQLKIQYLPANALILVQIIY